MHLERPLVFEFKLFFLLFFFYFVASPVALVVPNPSAAGFVASREAVITRATALGRGAASTSFLSEASGGFFVVPLISAIRAGAINVHNHGRKYITGVFINSVALRIHVTL
ncbi:uncharacterized protein DS421_1g13250 [Arachis hypogaea]|nr:uncharacterized protein DS421_1g13250 [Arachis hypogaea]